MKVLKTARKSRKRKVTAKIKMTSISCVIPAFQQTQKAILVYSPNIVSSSDIEGLKNVSKHSVTLHFSNFCFIECKSMLNSLNLHKILHEKTNSEFGTVQCYKVNASFNYQTYSVRSPKAKLSKEREVMKKTLELYETQNGIKDNALLILGQAVKAKEKENTERFLAWIHRLLGSECIEVLSRCDLESSVNQYLSTQRGIDTQSFLLIISY